MKLYIFLISIFFINASLRAQSYSIKQGDVAYTKSAYVEAIKYYSYAVKKDSNNYGVMSKLANCYRLTNNTKGQLACYTRLVKDTMATPLDKFYYAESVMEEGRPEQAKQYMDQYSADTRGSNMSKAITNLKVYYKNADAYKVEQVPFNSNESDFCPTLLNDTEIVFTSARSKTEWINRKHSWTNKNFFFLYSTFKSKAGSYSEPVLFAKNIQTKYNDGPICFSKDGKRIFLTRNNIKEGKDVKASDNAIKLEIMQAVWDSVKKSYSKPVEMNFKNPEYNFAHPAINDDGTKLYFSSDMKGGFGGMDLYVSELKDGAWGEPRNLGNKVNTAGNEVFPTITSKDMLYFSSNGLDGIGGLDVYETHLKNGEPTKIYNMGAPINSSGDDFNLVYDKTLKSGYFSSNRSSLDLNDDIYSFTVLRPVTRGQVLTVVNKDKTTGELLPYSLVKLCDTTLVANEKGEVQIDLADSTDCELTSSLDKYLSAKDRVSTLGADKDAGEIKKEMFLEKDPGVSLYALVTDISGSPMEGVNVSILDLKTGKEIDNFTTSATGDYRRPLPEYKIGDKITYAIKLQKPGYLSKNMIFNYDILNSTEIKVHELLDLKLGKMEVGADLGKLVDIKPIYFDVNKFNIRPDAATELNKVVAIMNEYPDMVIELGSHTDCRAPKAYNEKLSDSRAKASAAYIKKSITKPERIYGKGYGESKLVNGCACEGAVKSTCTDAEHQQNRRTEFIIMKLEK